MYDEVNFLEIAPLIGLLLPQTGRKIRLVGLLLPDTGLKIRLVGLLLPDTGLKIRLVGLLLPDTGLKIRLVGLLLPDTGLKIRLMLRSVLPDSTKCSNCIIYCFVYKLEGLYEPNILFVH